MREQHTTQETRDLGAWLRLSRPRIGYRGQVWICRPLGGRPGYGLTLEGAVRDAMRREEEVGHA